MARPPQGGRSPRDPGPRVNHQIRIKQVRVIDDEGNQLGVMETADAQAIANTKGLDLVEIAPNQRPPVCRIMDFGKYKYETKKKEQANKKKQSRNRSKSKSGGDDDGETKKKKPAIEVTKTDDPLDGL